MSDPDPLLAALAELDPAAGDAPPAAGSPRDRQILEHAMTDPTHRRRSRLLLLAGAGIAATVLAVVAVVVTGTPGDRPDPVAALTQAADTTAEVDTLRVHARFDGDVGAATIDIDVRGRDYHLRARPEPDGAEESVVGLGDQRWSDGDPQPTTVADDERPAPFTEASRAVVRAALRGAEVTTVGTEDVGGVDATRYRIGLGTAGVDALRALPTGTLGWFGLRHPQWVTSLEVWVADDLVRRIRLSLDGEVDGEGFEGSIVLDYRDFGADITIEPPG